MLSFPSGFILEYFYHYQCTYKYIVSIWPVKGLIIYAPQIIIVFFAHLSRYATYQERMSIGMKRTTGLMVGIRCPHVSTNNNKLLPLAIIMTYHSPRHLHAGEQALHGFSDDRLDFTTLIAIS